MGRQWAVHAWVICAVVVGFVLGVHAERLSERMRVERSLADSEAEFAAMRLRCTEEPPETVCRYITPVRK